MLEFKDWMILWIGALLGVPVSVLASLLVNPLLTVTWSYQLAKWLSYPLGWTAPPQLRNCQWRMEWDVTSTRFPATNPSPLKFYVFLNVMAGEWEATTASGAKICYRMVATRAATNKITGRWFDKDGDQLGYVGALQLVLSPTRDEAVGKWIGFSSDGSVKADRMAMVRV